MVQRPSTLHTEFVLPPVMFSPISSAIPPGCISKTRFSFIASSTTAPGTAASMVRVRLMQIAAELHNFLILVLISLIFNLYVPACATTRSTE